MNRFVSAALAGTVALTAVGMSATGASADRWHHHDWQGYQPTPRYQPAQRYDAGPAIVAGAILGLAVGSMMQPEPVYPAYRPYRAYAPPPPPPSPRDYAAYAAEEHYQWCASTYETYNGETDTWIDYRGVPHRCIGP